MKTGHHTKYHCCATCIHFEVVKNPRTSYKCKRLGFATKPTYRFDCWEPKEIVRKQIEKE